MDFTEAEAVKPFASFTHLWCILFNEHNNYTEMNGLNIQNILNDVWLDIRIGFYYDNYSFDYGGYFLLKDTKKSFAKYVVVPDNLI